MNEKKFEKKCPGPIDCFGDRDVLFRKVLIPMAMGDDTKFPPKNGAYRNSLVVYEANGAIYIYSSDGLYTKLSVAAGVNSVNGMYGDVILDIPSKLSQLQNDMGYITKDVDNLTNYTKTSGFNNVAFSGSYLDLSNKPAINNGQLTINRNGSTVGSFKANQAENTTVNIKVPVYTNELINNSQFVQDAHYVHTDNNFNNEWKSKLAHLADIQTIGNNLTLTNGRLDATGGVTPGDISSAIAAHNTSPTAHSDIRGEISGINDLIPNQASDTNQLADKAFVNSSVQTATANFRGNWTDWADVPTVATDYPADYAGSKTPTVNDYLVVQDASDYTLETLEGTWRFKYTGNWDVDGKSGWQPEYQVNETPLTAAQLAALNSGITAGLVANIPTAPNIVITLGVDGGGNMVWSGADSISDVRNAFNNGGSLRVEAPVLTDEIYNITEIWWKDSNHDALVLQSVDNDAALIHIELADNYSADMGNVNLQERLQAGANISINSNTISASVPTQTSQLANNGSDGTSTYVEASQLATVATSGSYNDLADKPTPFQIRTKLTANTNLDNRTPGIWPVENIAHPDFPVSGAMFGALIQYPDVYKTQVLLAGEAAGSGNENNMYYRRWLTGSSSWTAWASAQGSSITVDSALDNTSPNPVQNQALYPAIVPTEIYKTVYTYDWTGPAGTNLYNCVAILTMPAGTFTNNSLVELVNDDGFNNFAKHGFVLYGSEVSTQRLWITSIGKPTGTISLKFRIYKWGN